MGNYFISIGGTGAKCLESLVHLAAAGIFPDAKLTLLSVDPDQANGSLGRSQSTLSNYLKCSSELRGTSGLFKTEIENLTPTAWSPLRDDTRASLKEHLGAAALRAGANTQAEGLSALLDVLFTEKEQDTDLRAGFRGRPSIGSAVFADTVTLDGVEGQEPWSTFSNKIDTETSLGQATNVFLAGSIFGGTGASGLNTIGRLVKDTLNGQGGGVSRLGCAMFLPYFSFHFPPQTDTGIRANASGFIANSKSALKYYVLNQHGEMFDNIYLVGDQGASTVATPSVGGVDQRNPPHFVDLLGALAVAHFYEGDAGPGKDPVALLARKKYEELRWSDLPHLSGEEPTNGLRQLTRFSFAFLSVYFLALKGIKEGKCQSFAYPWYVDFFDNSSSSSTVESQEVWEQIEAVRNYCESFLLWIGGLQNSSEEVSIELVSARYFLDNGSKEDAALLNDLDREGFSNLIPDQRLPECSLNRLWNFLCSYEGPRKGLADFVHTLYEGCSLYNLR